MEIALIRDCWDVIRQMQSSLLDDACQPLANIEECLAHYSLPSLPVATREAPVPSAVVGTAKPTFKALTDDTLLALRHHVYAQTEPATVARWAETLTRFCEVRYRSLKQRAVSKCNSPAAAGRHVLHLAAFLMDQAICASDLRLVNTVLKLADLKWVLNRRALKGNLARSGRGGASALLQFRIVLTTEYALDRLRKDRVA